MRILFIGDIFGRPGRSIVKDRLPGIVRERGIDLIIANGENSAAGFGITPALAEELFELNIDVITTGNHVWDKREIVDYFQMGGFHVERTIVCRCGWRFTHYNAGHVRAAYGEHKAKAIGAGATGEQGSSDST